MDYSKHKNGKKGWNHNKFKGRLPILYKSKNNCSNMPLIALGNRIYDSFFRAMEAQTSEHPVCSETGVMKY